VGSRRLAWVVVVRSTLLVLPTVACAPPVAMGPACAARKLGPVSNQAVVVVDAASGQVLATLPVAGQPSAAGGG
jgi:D-alanyl-D-alanine carboxypeptidase